MNTALGVARITGPTMKIDKARANIEASDGRVKVDVLDRRTLEVIVSFEGAGTVDREFTVTDDDGGEWYVEKLAGCGCGGTKVNRYG